MGRCPSTFCSLCRRQRCTAAFCPSASSTALRSALEPSIQTSRPCSAESRRSSRSARARRQTAAFSDAPSHSPSGTFVPSALIPSAHRHVYPASWTPSSMSTSRSSGTGRAISSASAFRVRAMKRRETADLETERSSVPVGSSPARVTAGGQSGQHRLHRPLREQVVGGEVGVGLELELAPLARTRPRPTDRDLASAEDDLASARAVPAGAALAVVLALGADERNQLLLEQLVQHLQADADREREQALPHPAGDEDRVTSRRRRGPRIRRFGIEPQRCCRPDRGDRQRSSQVDSRGSPRAPFERNPATSPAARTRSPAPATSRGNRGTDSSSAVFGSMTLTVVKHVPSLLWPIRGIPTGVSTVS